MAMGWLSTPESKPSIRACMVVIFKLSAKSRSMAAMAVSLSERSANPAVASEAVSSVIRIELVDDGTSLQHPTGKACRTASGPRIYRCEWHQAQSGNFAQRKGARSPQGKGARGCRDRPARPLMPVLAIAPVRCALSDSSTM